MVPTAKIGKPFAHGKFLAKQIRTGKAALRQIVGIIGWQAYLSTAKFLQILHVPKPQASFSMKYDSDKRLVLCLVPNLPFGRQDSTTFWKKSIFRQIRAYLRPEADVIFGYSRPI
jgi:hypothetical protein